MVKQINKITVERLLTSDYFVDLISRKSAPNDPRILRYLHEEAKAKIVWEEAVDSFWMIKQALQEYATLEIDDIKSEKCLVSILGYNRQHDQGMDLVESGN